MADATGFFQAGAGFLAPPQSPAVLMSPMSSPSQSHRLLVPSSPSSFGGWVPGSPTGPAAASIPGWATAGMPFPGSPSGLMPGSPLGSTMPSAMHVSTGGSFIPGTGLAATSAGGSFVASGGHVVQRMSSSPPMGKVPSDGAPPFVMKVRSDGASTVTQLPSCVSTSGSWSSLGSKVLDDLDAEVRSICERIDTDGNGFISKLELIAAVQNDPVVASYVLPGKDSSRLMSCEETFDEVDAIFDQISGGKQRIKYADFASHFRKAAAEQTSNANEMRIIYDLIDADGNGSISKLELVAAVQAKTDVAAFLLPGMNCGNHVMNCEKTFDAINSIFESIAGGKRRIDFADFEAYFRKVTSLQPRQRVGRDRRNTRVFIIGPGFGQQLNPRQAAMITGAGFQVQWCHGIPNPETPNFPVLPYLDHIKAEIEAFQPDVVCCASKGGVYMVGLWQMGYWRGPSVLINAHPSCKQLPEGVPIVLAQGGNDEVYPTPRAELERIIGTGTDNKCFLYYVANSGLMPSGQHTRMGDFHNMETLLSRDCLPRLVDATLCPEGPEVHMVRSWRERLGDDRIEAELALGYSPERLRKRWATRGMDHQKLHDVARGSEEFERVAAVFKSAPKEPPAYLLSPQANWDRVQILSIQRVENGLQLDGSTKPYYDSLRRTLEDQGTEFEPGTHTCWAFHGASQDAIESIISNPLAGFQPLASGTRNSNVWGSGTYFARDAKYVADGGFCGQPAPDGTRRMLMCLLMTGMPCLGDPSHKGVLPFRNKPHRYNSSVDSLSSPEIFIVQHPGSALPGYLITFA
eukprot:gb/GFBE01010092.1/.p1 GENE.gb/GFBE01010092.1/~~gb/GFBE01010092.1/.p1  ORF type:complete len:802 (+),score=165.55 gb/GFBE01010092.1/:1-2406(+)